MIFALAGLAGMLLVALLDGEWARWRRRRADRRQLHFNDLRHLLGGRDPEPGVRRLPRRPFDWAQD